MSSGARRLLLKLHRQAGLAAGLLWCLQALSGLAIVFHWELEDARVPGVHRPTDLEAIGRRLEVLAPLDSDRRIVSVWTTAGAPDRYDVTVARGDGREVVRIAGDGTVLREKPKAQRDLIDNLVVFHQTLLAGDRGGWVIGTSGLLLASNLILGLVTAWPRRGTWRKALAPKAPPALTPQLFAWHRALGLWIGAPALVLVSAGALLAFDDPIRDLAGANPARMAAIPARGPGIGFAAAVRAAQARVPGAPLTAVQAPTDKDATYRIRLLAPGETRRAYGVTAVFVDANDGHVRGVAPAGSGPLVRRIMDGLYAIHTGEAEGLAGRLFSEIAALWLSAMIVLGGWLWLRRRRQSR